MGSKVSDPLLDSFHKLTDCTAAAERQALSRLTQPSNSGRSKSSARPELHFALALVNQLNHQFSRRPSDLQQLSASETGGAGAAADSVQRMVRVGLAAFRFLHGNRAAAGFGALALEKTLANFITACVNGHVGHWACDAMGVLHMWLVEYAESHVLVAAAGSGGSGGSRAVRKAAGARGARAAEGLAGGMRRLSISKPAAGVSGGSSRSSSSSSPGALLAGEKGEKRAPLVPTHFPIRYCQGDAAFNGLVVGLLCNGLRTLARGGAHARRATQEAGAELARRADSALDWCLRVQALGGAESADAHLQVCFRSYYALSSSSGSSSSEHSLELRLLALTAYANTRECDARELLKHAARAGGSGVRRFADGVAEQLRAQVDRAAVSPELLEFVLLVADSRRSAGDVDAAVAAWQLLDGRSGGSGSSSAADVACALLRRDTLVLAAVEGAGENLGRVADMLAAGQMDGGQVEAAVGAARNTLAGWNALALCGDRLRRTARRALGWLQQRQQQATDHTPAEAAVARAALGQLLAADALYHAYVARGAARRAAEDGGGGGVAKVCLAHGDACVTGVQLAVRLLEHADDAAHRAAVERLTARLLSLCEGAGDVRGLLRSHSTVMFNHAAALFRLGVFVRAAEAAELAISSLAMWVRHAGSADAAAAVADAVAQLCKRYEVAASAYQAAGAHASAGAAYARAAAFLSRRLDAAEIDGGARPPFSTGWAPGGAADRALVFVDRYARLCGARLLSDPDEPAAAMRPMQQAQAQWSGDPLVLAWLAEAEADFLRPLANSPGLASGGVQAARRALLEQALRLYAAAAAAAGGCAAGRVRCLLELGKAARDLGEDAQAREQLSLALELALAAPGGGQAGALAAPAEAHGWLAVMDIEQGGSGGKHAACSAKLWAQLAEQWRRQQQRQQQPADDAGQLRRALDAMGAFAGLLDSRAAHGAERLALRRAGLCLAQRCAGLDASAGGSVAAVEWLVALARECALAGDAAEAAGLFAQAAERCAVPGAVPAHAHVAMLAAEAECLLLLSLGSSSGGAQAALDRAAVVARRMDSLGGGGGGSGTRPLARGRRRAPVDAEWLVVLARAGVVQSRVALHRGALADAVDCALHAHRVVSALLQTLQAAAERRRRAQQQQQRVLGSSSLDNEDDPFGPAAEAGKAADAGAGVEAEAEEGAQRRQMAGSGDWALQRLAADCLGHLAHVHSVRGSVREAEYFATRMLAVATERLRAPQLVRRARRVLADILARRGALDECAALLDAEGDGEPSRGVLEDAGGLLAEGDAWRRLGRVDRALALYERAAAAAAAAADALQAPAQGATPPGLLGVLAEDVAVRRMLLSAEQKLVDDVDPVADAAGRGADRLPEHLLLHSTLSFDAAWRAAGLGPPGAGGAILLPSLAAAPADRRAARGRGAASDVRKMALAAYTMLRRTAALAVTAGSAHSVHASTRMLAMAAALVQTLGPAVSNAAAAAAAAVADMLDAPLNITVVRETADALRRQMVALPAELTAWPADVVGTPGGRQAGSPHASPVLRARQMTSMLLADDPEESESDDSGGGGGGGGAKDTRREAFFRGATDGTRLAALWPADPGCDAGADSGVVSGDGARLADVLPASWVVCGVSVDAARDVLLVTRYERARTPLALVLPLRPVDSLDALDLGEAAAAAAAAADADRGGSTGAFDGVLATLGAIVAASDRSMKTAAECVTAEDKRAWWEQRAQLDRALGRLLRRVETRWLGCLRRLLSPEPLALSDDAVAAVREALHACVLARVPRTYGARARRLVLSDELCAVVLAAAAAGSVESADANADGDGDGDADAWRDLCMLVWAVYCRRDAAPAADAQALEAFSEAVRDALLPLLAGGLMAESVESAAEAPAHLILALDKHAQQLPWETLPCLAGHPVSRVPSVAFLLDRLSVSASASASSAPHPAHTTDPSLVSYVLNPAGDLARTQAAFEPLVQAHPSWRGSTGRAPTSCEFSQALSASSVFLYFGHGGGEAYSGRALVRATRVRAVALLFGCSSARMRRMGEYDAVGTPADYVVAGCPALVGNLWDVGDKDIDRFAAEVLRRWGVDGAVAPHGGRPLSLAEAVCLARKVCRMPFLTGAAPVVYGIPVYLSSSSSTG
ncbi:separin protein [Coemansia erecta]|uniref:separase n=1 Tax=Coemansia erecta TaxID=147472 RepID=A0A9W7Y566_9FUNG|nr:separin protein [Coemansia erecta]